MLSMHSIPSQSASALAAYYEGLSLQSDAYYQGGAGSLEPAGFWQGQGAETLGFLGMVIADGELLQAMQGAHPRTGDALSGTQGNTHKPGWDLCFSAPKSVSVAWAIADRELRERIEVAHQNAVTRALEYLECDAISVRVRTDRYAVMRESVAKHGGALFATYQHSSSRAGDPQLHTHAVLMNITPARHSLDFSTAYVHAGGAIYRVELAYGLHTLGFGIERDHQSFKLSGAPKALTEHWSQRRTQIESEARVYGVHTAKGLETVTLATRTAKEAVPRETLFALWASEAHNHHYGIAVVSEQATLGVTQEFEKSPESCLLTALTETRATVSREQALVEIAARSYGQCNATDLEKKLDQALQDQAVVLHAPENRGEWHRTGKRYTTEEMLRLEQQLVKRCQRLAVDREAFHLPESSRHAVLEKATLSQEQRHAFDHALDSGRATVIQGAAGTGKSTLLLSVREVYEAENYRVTGTALSQRATQNLEEASGIPSRNVARLLHDLNAGNERLDDNAVLVVDEAGMLGTRQLENLTRRIEEAGAKIILVGDSRQLQAIEAGGAFRGIQERIGYAELTDNRRQQRQADRDMTLAFREGHAAEGLEILHKHGRLYLNENRAAVLQTAVLAYLQDLDECKSSLLLAKDRQAVHELNQAVRVELRSEGMLGESETIVRTTTGYRQLAENDRVVLGLGAKQQFYSQLNRNKHEYAHNGACGTVERVDRGQVTVLLDSGQRIELDAAGHEIENGQRQGWAVDHAYAVTVHKAQGMTVDRCHVVISGEEQREWAYVALSRHREIVHVYATHEALGVDSHSIERAEAVLQLNRAETKDLAKDYETTDHHPAHDLKVD